MIRLELQRAQTLLRAIHITVISATLVLYTHVVLLESDAPPQQLSAFITDLVKPDQWVVVSLQSKGPAI